jgi:hypothetical protein
MKISLANYRVVKIPCGIQTNLSSSGFCKVRTILIKTAVGTFKNTSLSQRSAGAKLHTRKGYINCFFLYSSGGNNFQMQSAPNLGRFAFARYRIYSFIPSFSSLPPFSSFCSFSLMPANAPRSPRVGFSTFA